MKKDNSGFWSQPPHMPVLGISILAGCLFIGLMTLFFGDTPIGIIFLDRKTDLTKYPFTIQNLMHILFFIGLGELFIRWRIAIREDAFVSNEYLPEDDETVLQSHDLGPIRLQVAKLHDGDHGFLPSLIDLCILQFQAGRSTDQTVSVLNSNLELIAHRVDLRYAILRYIVWVIPTFGFIGTVIGISMTLAEAGKQAKAAAGGQVDLTMLTTSLAVAFNTTLVALILSAILVLFLHLVQRKEEQSVNNAGLYTLKNLINRLYTGGD